MWKPLRTIFQGLVNHLKQQSLLRVHSLSLVSRDVEEPWIERAKVLIKKVAIPGICLQS